MIPGMTKERFQRLPMREQWLLVAHARVAYGLPPYDYGHNDVQVEVREDGSVAVRESASLSDMPNILGNNLYRQLDDWFASYTGTWKQYCKIVNLVDWRPLVVAFVSEMEDAVEIRQERDYDDSALLDKGYSVALKRWGRQFTLPYAVIENDDKGVIAELPEKMGNAADRTLQKIVVRQTLEANPNVYDNNPLFSAGRGNLVTGAGSAFSATNLQAAIATVQTATGDADLNPSGVPLNIPPSFLVVPSALQFQAAQVLNSATLIMAGTAGTVTTAGNQNPLLADGLGFKAPLTLVIERYLTNTTAWYVLPEKQYGPIVVALRQGMGLRPRMWRNIPMRQAVMGTNVDDYLLNIDDMTYGFNFDANAASMKPWSSIKYAGA